MGWTAMSLRVAKGIGGEGERWQGEAEGPVTDGAPDGFAPVQSAAGSNRNWLMYRRW